MLGSISQIHCHCYSFCFTVALNVALMDLDMFGSKLELSVGCEMPSQQQEQHTPEEEILTIQVSGLPPGMDNPTFLKMSIEHFLMKLEIRFKSCDIVNSIAYVTLEDPSSEFDICSIVGKFYGVQFSYYNNIIMANVLFTDEQSCHALHVPYFYLWV